MDKSFQAGFVTGVSRKCIMISGMDSPDRVSR